MNRPEDPFYHNKAAYKRLFPNHKHNNPPDMDCGVCVHNLRSKACNDRDERFISCPECLLIEGNHTTDCKVGKYIQALSIRSINRCTCGKIGSERKPSLANEVEAERMKYISCDDCFNRTWAGEN